MRNTSSAPKETYKELTTLLELIQVDGSIHDLDQYTPDDMQTVHGDVLCELMHRCQRYEKVLEGIVKDDKFSPTFLGDRGKAYVRMSKTALNRTFY